MRVILRERTHAHQTMQGAGGLETMDLAELGDLHRQLAITAQTVLENLHMARTIHRLDGIDPFVFLAFLRQKDHVRISRNVSGELPERFVHQLWRIDFYIAGSGLPPANVVLKGLKERPSFGVPKHRAGRFFLEMEEIHLASDTPMIALFGFLDLFEIS